MELRPSDASGQTASTCARLLMDSLKLSEEDLIMEDQQIIDIMIAVRHIAAEVERFPINPFVENGKDVEVAEFIREWKTYFQFSRFDAAARGHLFTSLGGEIGCAAIKISPKDALLNGFLLTSNQLWNKINAQNATA